MENLVTTENWERVPSHKLKVMQFLHQDNPYLHGLAENTSALIKIKHGLKDDSTAWRGENVQV